MAFVYGRRFSSQAPVPVPVRSALGPKAAKQLAEVLAALPALRAGAVDSLKAPPLTAPPAAADDEMRAAVTQPYKPPSGYPTKVPAEMLRKIDWRISYPYGTTHEVLRSTRSPDLSYYPQYDSPVEAAEVAALDRVLQVMVVDSAHEIEALLNVLFVILLYIIWCVGMSPVKRTACCS